MNGQAPWWMVAGWLAIGLVAGMATALIVAAWSWFWRHGRRGADSRPAIVLPPMPDAAEIERRQAELRAQAERGRVEAERRRAERDRKIEEEIAEKHEGSLVDWLNMRAKPGRKPPGKP